MEWTQAPSIIVTTERVQANYEDCHRVWAFGHKRLETHGASDLAVETCTYNACSLLSHTTSPSFAR